MTRPEAVRRAREMMDVFDLRAKAGVRAPSLSGGMRRRLLLARDTPAALLDSYGADSLADVYVKAMAAA
ncbi:MAG: hypothetical protein QOF83_1069, partial [Solirubrobacteraceae bacterium]|nr:hypothetical protein [Solirubrobacteraceae bacterium]